MVRKVAPNWYTLRFKILKRDNFTCQYCGQFAPNVILHVDHIKPVCEGGSDDENNLTTACAACNRGKEGLRLTTTNRRTNGKTISRWEMFCELEPRLRDLEKDVRFVVAGPDFCANAAWYNYSGTGESFKNRLAELVGWDAEHPELRGRQKYDEAYEYLYALLPNCQHEGPFC